MSQAKPVNDSTFEAEVIKSNLPVLVDFFASWCGPCQMMAPVIDQIAEKLADKMKTVKVDTDQNQIAASQYGIMSIPTLILFKNGAEAVRLVGYQPIEALENKLKQFV